MLEFWNKEAIALASIFPWILKEVLKNPASFRVSEVCTLIQTSKPLDKSKCSSNETSIFYETSSLKPVTEIFFSVSPYASGILPPPLTCSRGSLLLHPPLYLPLPPPHLQPRIPLAPPSPIPPSPSPSPAASDPSCSPLRCPGQCRYPRRCSCCRCSDNCKNKNNKSTLFQRLAYCKKKNLPDEKLLAKQKLIPWF